ncbi:MAG: NAD(P)/FAD-dependent oxidoreductase [Leptolyngbyaceae cyanobacterium CSU_1_4]|nr:NAD(P)/FAD-dependent oxidoreductase [Leptolyngbyaceae cyanobacterium CSU_1_4]
MRDYSQIVVGGGAAGFFGAIACAEAHPHAHVLLLEASHQPLTKVRISGGGRCNVTHACFDPALLVQHYPRGGRALRGAFSRFQPQDTVAWFQQRGVTLKTEADGRMFPMTDDSETIVNCLMQSARQAGVEVLTKATVVGVVKAASQGPQGSSPGFELELKSGEVLPCRRLLLTTGSSLQGYRFAQTLGHTIASPVPSLFTFTIPDPQIRELAGVAVASAQVRLLVSDQKPLEQTGAVLMTHWGMSGPAVLKLSAWGARILQEHQYRAEIQVNWLPGGVERVRQTLGAVKEREGKKAIATYCPFPSLSRRLWQYLLTRTRIAPETRWADLPKKDLAQLVLELTQGRYGVQGKGAFKDEFVTCGGVRLEEVDFKTMESRLCPGLHFAGEILDIDGVTGGFNFQSAWTTGWLAGQGDGGDRLGSRATPSRVCQ